jgi:hypothetical protein
MSIADIQTAGASIPYSEMDTSITVCALPTSDEFNHSETRIWLQKEKGVEGERKFVNTINP